MPFKHNNPKPIIGLAGGIGSGKSTIARLFALQGCAVIDSDQLSRQAINQPDIKSQLLQWLGPSILTPDAGGGEGSLNRHAIAARVFTQPADAARLNALIHPRVKLLRDKLMPTYLADPAVKAIIWDAPLLFEAGLHRDCDAVVFVNVPKELRLQRINASRRWPPEELDRREKLQFPLDKKAQLSDYCIDNSGDEASSLHQVQRVLSQILSSAV